MQFDSACAGRQLEARDPAFSTVNRPIGIVSKIGVMRSVSIITCPHCGYAAAERMPPNVCQIFYDCKGCGARLKPRPGDCCVFCSYGSIPCPSIQLARQDKRPLR